ncbi:Uncharacterised protein [Raoultella terrigena]|nr:Uncharacterised protein [Raoultella terrigena]
MKFIGPHLPQCNLKFLDESVESEYFSRTELQRNSRRAEQLNLFHNLVGLGVIRFIRKDDIDAPVSQRFYRRTAQTTAPSGDKGDR